MTATLDTPAAPPAVVQAPGQPTFQATLVELLASQDDAAQVLADLVLAVAAARPNAAEQLHVLRVVKNACKRDEDRDAGPRQALLDAVIAQYGQVRAGDYGSFRISPTQGRREVDYGRLMDRYPSVYADVVTTGPDGFQIKCTPSA
ncbi:hypothetical protein [Tsukamurella tyrosinosolvens]|nr:hypothetical protein [Tsukamurella tyrosinosolvens]KXO92968.1 hypothetical protein AXK58_13945 [Tsukamurella tyrosinosolvens]